MKITSLVIGTTIAITAATAPAFSAEKFATLEQTTSVPLTSMEMTQTRGEALIVFAGCASGLCLSVEKLQVPVDIDVDTDKLPPVVVVIKPIP